MCTKIYHWLLYYYYYGLGLTMNWILGPNEREERKKLKIKIIHTELVADVLGMGGSGHCLCFVFVKWYCYRFGRPTGTLGIYRRDVDGSTKFRAKKTFVTMGKCWWRCLSCHIFRRTFEWWWSTERTKDEASFENVKSEYLNSMWVLLTFPNSPCI